MTPFEVIFKPSVYFEIQEIIDYYNLKSKGLGKRFLQLLSRKIEDLKLNPFYQVR